MGEKGPGRAVGGKRTLRTPAFRGRLTTAPAGWAGRWAGVARSPHLLGVVLRQGCSVEDEIRAFIHASFAAEVLRDGDARPPTPVARDRPPPSQPPALRQCLDEGRARLEALWPSLRQGLLDHGWDLERVLLGTSHWRAQWAVDAKKDR